MSTLVQPLGRVTAARAALIGWTMEKPMADRLTRALPFLLAPLVLLPAASRAGEIPAIVDAALIPAYHVIEPGVATAGQPAPEALQKLKEMGFRTVVNLRTEKEGAAAERPVVEALGLRYVWVPITPETLNIADIEAVEKVLADSGSRPVLLHCASSNRVGGVWTALQMRKGKSLEQAEAAGKEAGLHSPVVQAAVRRVLGAPAAPATPPKP
jgi:uncharacterized protein (TIGR01244 family)